MKFITMGAVLGGAMLCACTSTVQERPEERIVIEPRMVTTYREADGEPLRSVLSWHVTNNDRQSMCIRVKLIDPVYNAVIKHNRILRVESGDTVIAASLASMHQQRPAAEIDYQAIWLDDSAGNCFQAITQQP